MGKIIERDLPFTLPKTERKEMSLTQKQEFYAMPLDVQLYYRQFNPPLGEPQVKKENDDDYLWFSKPPCKIVPSKRPELKRKHRGYLDFDGVRTEDESREWEDYLESLAPETRTYIESIISQGEGGGTARWLSRNKIQKDKEMKENIAHLDEEESEKKKTADDQGGRARWLRKGKRGYAGVSEEEESEKKKKQMRKEELKNIAHIDEEEKKSDDQE